MHTHLEGLGWLGSALAYHLHHRGLGFTWSDTDEPVTAWRASTGLVYPAGDQETRFNLRAYPAFASMLPPRTVAPVAYWYAHKHPPHGATFTNAADLGWLRLADASAFVVDVPAVVTQARADFAHLRHDQAPAGARRVIAHGHHPDRRSHWIWGWSAPVQLQLPNALAEHSALPPVLYGAAHRFAICYAYPIPTRPGWWRAGSDMRAQRAPGPGRPEAALDRWRGHVRSVYGGHVRVTSAATPVEGWRPKPHAGDTGRPNVDSDGTITLPPLSHSGVRLAPGVINATVRILTEGGTQ